MSANQAWRDLPREDREWLLQYLRREADDYFTAMADQMHDFKLWEPSQRWVDAYFALHTAIAVLEAIA